MTIVKFVFPPFQRVITDIFTDIQIGFMVADDVFVKIALP